MRRRRPTSSRAFTLIELVLTLALMALLMAMVAPQLRGFGRGQRVENAADEFIAAAAYARSEAVVRCVPYRLEVTDDGTRLLVTTLDDTGEFLPVESRFGEGQTLPGDVTISIEPLDGGSADFVEFFPNNTLTPADAIVTGPDGKRVATLRAEGIADPFRRLSPQEAR